MSLQQTETLPSGVVGNYWKIVSIEVDRIQLIARFTLELFLDQDHSNSGSDPIGCPRHYSGTFTKEQLNGDLPALGYDLIMTDPFFSGASSV